MSELAVNPSLKEINAYKKKLNWGEIPSIYQLAMSAISDMDSLMTHGFDSPYKQLLDKNNWNKAYYDNHAEPSLKPKIMLYHDYSEQDYELHCYPIINNEPVSQVQVNNPQCPFIQWLPKTMQMLFRLNSLIPFIVYTFQKGDKADYALLRFTHQRVEELINLLTQSFDIVEIKGYSIAEFCQEIHRKHEQKTDPTNPPKPMGS
ncbi:hypothetical protein SAMN05216262_10550 [Colwellia chukchiensis]|uniref:Uncharacterized protein n=1 Tax=Colwellia chukchiensis TaxID=641665 RepID=A0A1H7M0J9_9GAMM|nr:hypothetical protein [Colwellia chukchiensis]SEL04691.1 hypothetical protein SAMN05216262_10550 [Colwellia chukchiensis]